LSVANEQNLAARANSQQRNGEMRRTPNTERVPSVRKRRGSAMFVQ